MSFWQITPEWQDQTAFIVASGPSLLTQNLELLRGQHIIAINSAFELVPFAEFLVFADGRWHAHYKRKLESFRGRIVCCSRTPRDQRLLMVKRKTPGGLATERDTLSVQKTSATAAINLAVHLGANRIVALGLDGKNGPDGKTHAHLAHPWKQVPSCFSQHRRELQGLVGPLKERGIEMVLASPGSAYRDLWPTVELESLLGIEKAPENACAAA